MPRAAPGCNKLARQGIVEDRGVLLLRAQIMEIGVEFEI